MFYYNFTMIPHLFCSNLPQIHQNKHTMCRFQHRAYMCRFHKNMSIRFTLNVYLLNFAYYYLFFISLWISYEVPNIQFDNLMEIIFVVY